MPSIPASAGSPREEMSPSTLSRLRGAVGRSITNFSSSSEMVRVAVATFSLTVAGTLAHAAYEGHNNPISSVVKAVTFGIMPSVIALAVEVIQELNSPTPQIDTSSDRAPPRGARKESKKPLTRDYKSLLEHPELLARRDRGAEGGAPRARAVAAPHEAGADTYPLVVAPYEADADTARTTTRIMNEKEYELPVEGTLDRQKCLVEEPSKPEVFNYRVGEIQAIHEVMSKEGLYCGAPTKYRAANVTTERAIEDAESCSAYPLAVLYANFSHLGGGTNLHKDKESGEIRKYPWPSACAQEESGLMGSTVAVSLLYLPHTSEKRPGDDRERNFLKEPLESRSQAVISRNCTLFAVPYEGGGFSGRKYIPPVKFTCISSAAKVLRGVDRVETGDENHQHQIDVIRTHLTAAAGEVIRIKRENPAQKVELIAGAIGCGAFGPRLDAAKYAEMTVNAYLAILENEFKNVFDTVTFAVPTFGDDNPRHKGVINHNAFSKAVEEFNKGTP